MRSTAPEERFPGRVPSEPGIRAGAGARGVRERVIDRVRGIAFDPGDGDLRGPGGEGEDDSRPWPRPFREGGGDPAWPAHLRPAPDRDERRHPRRVPGESGLELEPDQRDDLRAE